MGNRRSRKHKKNTSRKKINDWYTGREIPGRNKRQVQNKNYSTKETTRSKKAEIEPTRSKIYSCCPWTYSCCPCIRNYNRKLIHHQHLQVLQPECKGCGHNCHILPRGIYGHDQRMPCYIFGLHISLCLFL